MALAMPTLALSPTFRPSSSSCSASLSFPCESTLVSASSSYNCNTHFSSALSFRNPSPSKKRRSLNPSLIYSPCFSSPTRLICRAAEYKFPDPIPEFAIAEAEKFRSHLVKKLSKKEDLFGDSLDEVVEICTAILGTFLHDEYGGPGTLLVIPFIDMADTLNEQGLPGGPQAARAAVKWAQTYVDNDWKEWNSSGSKSKK